MIRNKKPKTINPEEIDPSVYYYDEVYDDMKNKESLEDEKVRQDKRVKQESKYIKGLMETADLRKSENDLRKFKRLARDREEAELNGTLEGINVFITPAYEKKLKEMKLLAEKHEKRLAHDAESELNFSKYKDLGASLSPCQSKLCNDLVQVDAESDEAKCITVPVDISKDETISTDTSLVKRNMNSIEDRERYLKNVLAKRTVGQVFIEAQTRYKQRMAQR